jgi:hypothetical protein
LASAGPPSWTPKRNGRRGTSGTAAT